MPYSRIVLLWEGDERKVLNKLRYLDLSYSKVRTLDLGMTPNLERLDLNSCRKLVEICAPVGCLKRLVYLDLRSCLRFASILFMKRLDSLGVFSLTELHLSVKLYHQSLKISDHGLPKLLHTFSYKDLVLSSIRNPEKLVSIDGICTKLESFSDSICCLLQLKKLELNKYILEVPEDLDQLQCLEELYLTSTHIKRLPDSICMLKHLTSLELRSCVHLEKLPENIGRLICLEKLHLSSTLIKRVPDSICMLKHMKSLELRSCDQLEYLPEDLGRLICLEELHLSSTHIKRLPDSICMLKHLKSLGLRFCDHLENLPTNLGQLTCLEKLILTRFKYFQDIPNSICMMRRLKCLCLRHCTRIMKLPEELGCLEHQEKLDLRDTNIRHLPQSLSLLKGLRIVGNASQFQSSSLTINHFSFKGSCDDDANFCHEH